LLKVKVVREDNVKLNDQNSEKYVVLTNL